MHHGQILMAEVSILFQVAVKTGYLSGTFESKETIYNYLKFLIN
jgi:hypothetical protein